MNSTAACDEKLHAAALALVQRTAPSPTIEDPAVLARIAALVVPRGAVRQSTPARKAAA